MADFDTYAVWATSKAKAIEKAEGLAKAAGRTVLASIADRFPEGAMYKVNWKVRVYWQG